MRPVILALCFCLSGIIGCGDTPVQKQEREQAAAHERAKAEEKLKLLKDRKVVTVRLSDNSVDLITVEGEIYTFYAYSSYDGKNVVNKLGVK